MNPNDILAACERLRNDFRRHGVDMLSEGLNAKACGVVIADVETVCSALPLLVARVRELEAILAKLPHTADGVPVVGGETVYCPKGHPVKLFRPEHRIYCVDDECWSDGCQGDSGSGTYHPIFQCSMKGGGDGR